MSKASNIGARFLRQTHGKTVAETDGYEILIAAVKVRAKDGSDTDTVNWAEARPSDPIDEPTLTLHWGSMFKPEDYT